MERTNKSNPTPQLTREYSVLWTTKPTMIVSVVTSVYYTSMVRVIYPTITSAPPLYSWRCLVNDVNLKTIQEAFFRIFFRPRWTISLLQGTRSTRTVLAIISWSFPTKIGQRATSSQWYGENLWLFPDQSYLDGMYILQRIIFVLLFSQSMKSVYGILGNRGNVPKDRSKSDRPAVTYFFEAGRLKKYVALFQYTLHFLALTTRCRELP